MLIGITGGIGSGKSTIAAELRRLGYPVYDCDREAKRILTRNKAVRSQVEYLFGSDVYRDDIYQTRLVAEQVFRDPTLLDKLNHIVHPAVRFDVHHWKQDGLCFVESAILFESGLYEECDRVAVVTAPLEIRVARTMERDHANREAVLARISAQMPEEDRLARAHYIINNDGQESIPILVENMLYNIKNAIA